ncbi:hypothetical protein Pdw03_1484 [Penicillium digitatum]|uniref:Uncharacterized protein n=1 Tax=Penicillium digitatum TaxID=36651 RepID=A0A7T6XSW1_PENDI|nr:hypothetical protein Pdw03_1484 [Penicillium digitatum]
METPLCLSPRELFLSPQGEQNFSINPWRGTHLDIHKCKELASVPALFEKAGRWRIKKIDHIGKMGSTSVLFKSRVVAVFLTMHPTFHTSTLYVHGTPRITSGAR